MFAPDVSCFRDGSRFRNEPYEAQAFSRLTKTASPYSMVSHGLCVMFLVAPLARPSSAPERDDVRVRDNVRVLRYYEACLACSPARLAYYTTRLACSTPEFYEPFSGRKTCTTITLMETYPGTFLRGHDLTTTTYENEERPWAFMDVYISPFENLQRPKMSLPYGGWIDVFAVHSKDAPMVSSVQIEDENILKTSSLNRHTAMLALQNMTAPHMPTLIKSPCDIAPFQPITLPEWCKDGCIVYQDPTTEQGFALAISLYPSPFLKDESRLVLFTSLVYLSKHASSESGAGWVSSYNAAIKSGHFEKLWATSVEHTICRRLELPRDVFLILRCQSRKNNLEPDADVHHITMTLKQPHTYSSPKLVKTLFSIDPACQIELQTY